MIISETENLDIHLSDTPPEGKTMAESPDIESEDAAYQFLVRYMEDQERGRVLTTEEYQDLFPDHRELIAQRIEALRAAPSLTALSANRSASLVTPERIGRFRILHQIGRGGQGNVFLARDEELRRNVALKLLSLSGLLAPDSVKRFHREAELASRLDHPGICTVYEAGESDDVFYIAMQHVEGVTLAERIEVSRRRDGESLIRLHDRAPRSAAMDTPRTPGAMSEVLRFFEETARALHAAHELGLVHRDIKPQNLMVTPEQRPVVLDFGLARDLESDQPTLTRAGDLMGTPHYISPEQLADAGESVDCQADVYSLGVTLYESLTLRRPYDGPSRESLFKLILEADLPDPRSLSPRISRDLAVVLQTALERDRSRRYHTALELAEELRRVRLLEPIRARPASQWIQLRRWSQRNPILATATVAIFVLLTAGLIASLIFNQALRSSERHSRALALVGRSVQAAERDDLLSLLLARRAVEVEENVETVSQLHVALSEMKELARCGGHGGYVATIDCSSNGKRFVTAGKDCIKLWDETGLELEEFPAREFFTAACFSPDGKSILASSSVGMVRRWDLGDDQLWDANEDRYFESGDNRSGPAWHAAFSPDGESIVTSSGSGVAMVRSPKLESTRELPHGRSVYHAEFSPDGMRIVTSCGDGKVRIWEKAEGDWKLELAIPAHQGPVWRASFSPDGEHILSFSSSGGYATENITDFCAHLWNRFGDRIQSYTHAGVVWDARFSGDGRFIVTTSAAGEAVLWNLADQDCRYLALDRVRSFHSGIFSPEGDRVSITGSGGVVRVLDLAGNQLANLHGHWRNVFHGKFSPDGTTILTAGFDDTVRMWKPFSGDPLRVPLSGNLEPRVAVNPRHELLAITSSRGTIELRNEQGGLELDLEPGVGTGWNFTKFCWDRSGDRILGVSRSGQSVIWKRDGTRVGSYPTPVGAAAGAVSFTPNPNEFLVNDSGRVIIISLEGRNERVPFSGFREWLSGVAYSPDGEYVVTAGWDSHLRLFGAEWGDPVWERHHRDHRLNDVNFSPDGEKIIVACDDGCVYFYGLDGELLRKHRAYDKPILSARFSGDAGALLVCSTDGTAQLWAKEDKLELKAILHGHHGDIHGEFLPSGKRFVTVSSDNLLRFWEVDTTKLIELTDRRISSFPPEVRDAYADSLTD